MQALQQELQIGWNTVPQEEIAHMLQLKPRSVRKCVSNRGMRRRGGGAAGRDQPII